MHSSTTPTRALVFDSGLGGLSVVREIQRLMPALELTYFADSAFYPYGTQTELALQRRVVEVIEQLEQRFAPELIVLACNSASTVVLPQLRARTSTPVVGVVPAIKPAAEASQSGVIGLLATPGTVLRQYTDQLIANFADHCEVVPVGSSELVDIAEAKIHGRKISMEQIASLLAPFRHHPRSNELDTMVLACTHFPLLREELASAFGRDIRWLDSGEAIARRVQQLLKDNGEGVSNVTGPQHCLWSSAPLANGESLQQQLSSFGFQTPPQLFSVDS